MKVKIYGERHTGTVFLRSVLQINGNCDLWPGTFYELTGTKFPKNRSIASWSDWERRLIREAMIDDAILSNYKHTLGWKHSAVDFKRMQSVDLHDTKFIVIVKHPVAWVLSLFRRTQQNILKSNKSSIEKLVKSPWLTVRRDNLAPILPSIVSSWSLKYAGYLRLAQSYDTCIIRYEDLLSSQEGSAILSKFLGVNGALKLPDRVRSRGNDLSYYRTYYANEQWRQETSEDLREAIRSRIDLQVVDRLMYSI